MTEQDTQQTRIRYAIDFLSSGGWLAAADADYLNHYLDRCKWVNEMSEEIWQSIPEWDFQELLAEEREADSVWKSARSNVPRRLYGIVLLIDEVFAEG